MVAAGQDLALVAEGHVRRASAQHEPGPRLLAAAGGGCDPGVLGKVEKPVVVAEQQISIEGVDGVPGRRAWLAQASASLALPWAPEPFGGIPRSVVSGVDLIQDPVTGHAADQDPRPPTWVRPAR